MSQLSNTGTKIYTLLVEYNTRTGLPTGHVKPNVPSDPNYIDPVTDLGTCPLPSGIIPMINILVDLSTGFTCTVKLLFGSAEITRSSNGTWSVVDRIYDAVQFGISVIGGPKYKLRIEYGSSEVKEIVDLTAIGTYFIPGPFEDITKISIIKTAGDYSDDFNNDFYI